MASPFSGQMYGIAGTLLHVEYDGGLTMSIVSAILTAVTHQ